MEFKSRVADVADKWAARDKGQLSSPLINSSIFFMKHKSLVRPDPVVGLCSQLIEELTGMAKMPPLIMKLAMPAPLATLSPTQAMEGANESLREFHVKETLIHLSFRRRACPREGVRP